MLCAGRLTTIRKPTGGVRPIAVGESLYRLIVATLLNKKFGEGSLLPSQLGVKSPGGVDPIARAFELATEGKLDQQYTHAVSLDGVNAKVAVRPCLTRFISSALRFGELISGLTDRPRI